MNTKKVLIVVFCMLSVNVMAEGVPKGKFVSAMETGLPVTFCNSKSFFRQCFNITDRECEEVAISATRVCVKKYNNEIPDPIQHREDAGKIGNDVGRCVGETLSVSFLKQYISNTTCNSVIKF
jgi:hypothetical protein